MGIINNNKVKAKMAEDLQDRIWQLERRIFQLQTLYEVAQALNRCREPEPLYSQILATMAGTFGAREGLALRQQAGEWQIVAYRGSQTRMKKAANLRLPRGFATATASRQQEMLSRLLHQDRPFDPGHCLWEHVQVRDQVVGGFYFDRKIIGEPYSSHDGELLRTVCSYASHVLENLMLYQQLAEAHQRLAAENLTLRQQVRQESLGRQIIGNSPHMQKVRDLIHSYARSEAPVLISGETGTGKELVARAIHE
ncbi:MAG: hypothetical protein D6814_01375, partial [Calditrichaeota bacterium]